LTVSFQHCRMNFRLSVERGYRFGTGCQTVRVVLAHGHYRGGDEAGLVASLSRSDVWQKLRLWREGTVCVEVNGLPQSLAVPVDLSLALWGDFWQVIVRDLAEDRTECELPSAGYRVIHARQPSLVGRRLMEPWPGRLATVAQPQSAAWALD